MPSNVDADVTDASMGLHSKSQKPWETNTNEVHNDQHGTDPEQIHTLPGNQDDHSTLTSMVNSKSSTLTSVTKNKGHPRNNSVTLTSSPFIKRSN